MKDIRGLFALWAFSNKVKISRSKSIPYIVGIKTAFILSIIGVITLAIVDAHFLYMLGMVVGMLYASLWLSLLCINASEKLLTRYILKNKDKFEVYRKEDSETFYQYGNLHLCVGRFSDATFVRVYIGSEQMNVFGDDYFIHEGSNIESISGSLLNH